MRVDHGHVEEPVEVGPDPAVLGRLLGRPLQPAELALGLHAHVLRHPGVGDLRPVLLDDVLGAVLAELLADRRHLLAQQDLALPLLQVAGHLVADPLAHLDLGERLLRPAEDLLEPRLDVQRLQDLHLLLEREVGE